MPGSQRKSQRSLGLVLAIALFASVSIFVLWDDLEEDANNIQRHLQFSENGIETPDPNPLSDPSLAITRTAFTEATCLSFNISPIVPPDPNAPKYIVFYPRNGMGNVLMGYVSSVIYACLTGRILKIAPRDERETDEFDCPEYFDATENAGGNSICSDLEMDKQLTLHYKSSHPRVKRPDPWAPGHCPGQKPDLEYFLCDDGLANDEFIAVYSCHYWADIFLDNPYFKTSLSPTTFRDVLRSTVAPSAIVEKKMVPDDNGPYQVCVHVRWELEITARSLGTSWLNDLGTCVRNILSRHQEDDNAKKEVLLFTIHEEVRDAIKSNLEGGDVQYPVRFASETVTTGGHSGHSNDKHQAVADMFSMGKQCVHLLPSIETSTYLLMGANLMDNVSVFPGKQWKGGCLEGTEVTDMTPVSDYWNAPKLGLGLKFDVCNIGDSTCKVKDGSTITELKPPLRFYPEK